MNTMLRLKNIARNNDYISANYYPEDSEIAGFVSVDINSGEIFDSDTTSYDGYLNAYLSHAARALSEMSKSDSLPSERLVMWY